MTKVLTCNQLGSNLGIFRTSNCKKIGSLHCYFALRLKTPWHAVCFALFIDQILGGQMKGLLIATYVLIVLLISAFAKADTLTISRAQYLPEQSLLKISGTYFGICLDQVRPSLTFNDKTKGSEARDVLLNLIESAPCATQYKRIPFEMAIDVRALGLPEGQMQTLHFNHAFEKRTPVQISVKTEQSIEIDYSSLSKASGVVTQTADRKFVLLGNDGSIIQLRGPFDFANYVGQTIAVHGYEMNVHIQPIVASDVNDFAAEPMNRTLMVLNIFALN